MSNPERKGIREDRSRRKLLRLALGGVASVGSTALATNILSRAVEELLTPRVAESAQTNPLELEFDIGSDHYLWNYTNGTGGIYPPNDPQRRTGTVRVEINGVNYISKYFQPLVTTSTYPEIADGLGVAITVGGMAVDIPRDKYYLSTATTRNDGNYDPRFEMGVGVKTPESYTGRVVIRKGFPTGGINGLMDSSQITLGTDAKGNYANLTYTDCIDSRENGIYQVRLDSLANFIGDTVTKLPDSVYKAYLSVVPNNVQQR